VSSVILLLLGSLPESSFFVLSKQVVVEATEGLRRRIEAAPDLTQTSVSELLQAFTGNEFFMKRLSAFLTKRCLAFGMKFLPW
jgi:hypothetical protein